MVSCGFAKADPRQPGHDFLALQITGLWLTAERDLGGWLRGLDLGQYEATFRENEIDESVLPSLTAEDLKESASALSVIAGRHFGSARRFKQGCAFTGLGFHPSVDPGGGQDRRPRSGWRASGRHDDVLRFGGTTGISARLHAEEWRDLVGAYLDAGRWRQTNGCKNRMDQRIKSFVGDVLELAGEDPDVIRDEVRVALGDYEAIFRAQEPNRRTRDQAADACRTLCRARVAEEFERHRETPIAEHLKLVLNVIDEHVR